MATIDASVLTGVIAAATSVAVVVVTHYLQKKREDTKVARDEKLTYYKELMRAISDCVEGNTAADGAVRFAEASNLAPLYASNGVQASLYKFRHAIRDSATAEERLDHDRLLTALIQEIRNDLGIGGNLVQDRVTIGLWSAGNSAK
jgi:hypothetical protein